MNLNITGHHLDVTPAIREYIHTKMTRVLRHAGDPVTRTIEAPSGTDAPYPW